VLSDWLTAIVQAKTAGQTNTIKPRSKLLDLIFKHLCFIKAICLKQWPEADNFGDFKGASPTNNIGFKSFR
jgi:hypothetical protein